MSNFQYAVKPLLVLFASLLLLGGCGSKRPLVETASFTVSAKEHVEIRAEEGYKRYSWKQLSGASVEIADPSSPILSFTAPDVETKEVLSFELTAERLGVPFIAVVRVTVLPLPEESPDHNGSIGGEGNDQNGTQDDNGTTGGTDTNTTAIHSLALTIGQTTLNRDYNTTIKVEAVYKDTTAEEVTDRVAWLITPSDAVKIEGDTITALKDTDVTIRARYRGRVSNPVTLHVYWEVDGHRLPSEPDPKINNATLLGVDSNHNGVRDDVERKVYATYKKAIERAVMMQAFRTEQAMLADPDLVKNAREWEKKIWKAINCNDYLSTYRNTKPMSRKDVERTTNWQINTEERIKKYFKYDQALSGGVYSIKDGTLQDCEFDVEKVLEMDR